MKKYGLTTVLICLGLSLGLQAEPVSLKVGHVGHDHHTALFVALDNASDYTLDTGITVKVLKDRKFYQVSKKGQKIADIEIIKVGGGSKMPTALAQGVIDIGFGGVAAVLASVDSGAPVKLIAPLHYKGDMFVVKPGLPMRTWKSFVEYARRNDKPIRVGYKNPVAVAKLVFEEALTHEGLSFTNDLSQRDAHVHMICTKGGGKLNVSLGAGLIEAYVGNNPFPAIAVEKKIGRIVCDLEDLPPGTFKDHPCCCIGANTKALAQKGQAIKAMLMLFIKGTETINKDLDKTVAAAVHWIGTSEAVERMSIPTSGYAMQPSPRWQATMDKWIQAMNGLGTFQGKLKGLAPAEACAYAYDMSLLKQAEASLVRKDSVQ